MGMLRFCLRLALVLGTAVPAGGMAADDTLAAVRERGAVRCAVDGTPGFGGLDREGQPAGVDVAFCRAVAAAVLGDAQAVRIERISTANKFQALVANEVDLAFGMATWTLTRDAALGVRFVAPVFHDGQALMAWTDTPLRSLTDAAGKRVCVQSGTTSAANLADVSRVRGLALQLVESPSTEMRLQRFLRRDCELISGDRAELAAVRATRTPDPARWQILDETFSREPLGPYVRAGDERWFGIVRWVINATLIAEVYGIDSGSIGKVDEHTASGEVRMLAGRDPTSGAALGLGSDWARNVIAQVGNYAEIFARSVGRESALGLERGPNALWRDGGLFFPPPLR